MMITDERVLVYRIDDNGGTLDLQLLTSHSFERGIDIVPIGNDSFGRHRDRLVDDILR
jgi:hypothetical protein